VATMMLEIPETLKAMYEPLCELLAEAQAQVDRGGALGRDAQYEAFEGRLVDKLAAVERGAHEAGLSALDVDAAQILINGVLHVRAVRDRTTYMSQAGEVPLMHTLYRRAGDRNGPTVDPVALRAGAIDGAWLPGAARDMAYLLSQGTSREAEATAREMRRLPYSRSSFERIGHAVGDAYVGQHQHVEQLLIEAYEVPREVCSVSASLDRVSLPMEEPRPRPRGRPRKGAPKRPIDRVYRMAYCCTVTMHDAEGKAIHTIRYGTMPACDAAVLCEGLASDVLAIRRNRRGLPLMLLCDGAPEMWNLLDEAFDAETFEGVEIRRLIDFWHVIEKLSAAAKVIVDGDAASALLARWKLMLLNRSKAREQILDELVASNLEHVRVGESQPVHDAITYLTNNVERMNYARARRNSLPIGSGNVEATCKSLVDVRMKRPGSRWKTDTGEHVLHLRALALSDRWTEAMDLTLRPPRTRIRVAA
jgi:hypothetical protein